MSIPPLLHRAVPALALTALLVAGAASPSLAGGGADPQDAGDAAQQAFQRAFWLAEHDGALAEARALYERVADDANATGTLRAEAERRAAALAQDLLAEDLAQLLPAGAFAYAELSSPGEHLAGLLEQLGLYGDPNDLERFGISPDLVRGLLGAKGMAVALTSVPSPGGLPSGVAVLHPGDHAILRGLIETVLPAQARPLEPIEDYPTWGLPVERGLTLYVTRTERLVVASTDPYEIGAVVERMRGDDEETLANDTSLAAALEARHGALLSICIDARPLLPMVHALAQQAAAQDPEVALALTLADVNSLRNLSAHLTAGEDGLGLQATLELAEGHRSLAFDLLRRPNVERETFALVPEGAAFALATALNPAASVAPLPTDATGRPVVSLLDLGRELFGNLVDLAVFGLPGDGREGGLPDVALVLRSNDTARTKGLLDLGLGLAIQAASPGASPAGEETLAGVAARRYDLPGVPLFVGEEAGRVIVTPSRAAFARAVDAGSGRGSLLEDPLFAEALETSRGGDTLLLLAAPGRLARMAAPLAPGDARERLGPLADLLDGTSFSARCIHDDTRFGLALRLRSLPDVSALVTRALRGEDPFATPLPKAAERSAVGAPAAATPASESARLQAPAAGAQAVHRAPRGPMGPAPAAPLAGARPQPVAQGPSVPAEVR